MSSAIRGWRIPVNWRATLRPEARISFAELKSRWLFGLEQAAREKDYGI